MRQNQDSSSSRRVGGHTQLSRRHMIPRGGGVVGNTKHIRDDDHMGDTYGLGHPELDEIPDYDDAEYDDWDSHDDDVDDAGDNGDGGDGDHPSQRELNVADTSHDTFHQKPLITVVGKRFTKSAVHRSIRVILVEHYDGPWATFKDIPRAIVSHMFNCFRTRWSWYPQTEKRVHDAFIYVLGVRFRDFVLRMRKKAFEQATEAGIELNENNRFSVIVKFPPTTVTLEVWKKLCLFWGSEKWNKQSESGRKNRASADSSGMSSRHTGGSIGFDEHRIRLERKLGRPPTFRELFLHTHLTKEAKKRFWNGELDFGNLDEGEFCTARSKEAYEAYVKKMIEMHGLDFEQQPDDQTVWASLNGDKFGMGSADSGFVVTGKESTSFVSPSSQEDLKKSQEEVQKLRAQLDSQKKEMETKLESERRAREDAQNQMLHQQQQWQENFQREMAELKRQFISSGRQPN